ncbi:hypothetical protein AB0O51_20875 [Streptomyces sp. NPDC090301]|uniref:hypothetical protein n=1 Tax=Streptomyces sp. NPDC090301 TaxID=3154975 RepID=UPI003431DA3F
MAAWAADLWAEVRPLNDGADVLGEAHPAGLAPHCRNRRGPAGDLSYGYELLLTGGEPVEEQVRRCGGRLLADDPRNTAEILEA